MIDTNKFIRDLIVELAKEVQEQNNGKNDWIKVSNRLGQKYGIVKTSNNCKKVYQRWQKQDKLPPKNDEPSVKELNKASVEHDFKTGLITSDRIIEIQRADINNADELLKAHGYNPLNFELINVKSNYWTGLSKDDGQIVNFQSKITLRQKTSQSELTKEDILDIVANFKPIERDFKLKQVNTHGKEKLALEIDFADFHIGSFSWNEEVGNDYDIKIALEKVNKIIKQATEIIDLYPIEKIYLCFLGDFVHIDTVDSTTSKGTRLDSDSRPKKIAKKSLEVAMHIIEELAMVETEVIWVEGNHSRLVEYTVFMSLPYIYQNAKHIKFHVEPISRKAFMYKGNLIALHHGEIKKTELFTWVQEQFKELWGQSTYVEQHSGHFHQESVVEKGGIIQRTNPTLKEQDLYEFENGWKSYKAVVAYLWSEKENLKAQFYLR